MDYLEALGLALERSEKRPDENGDGASSSKKRRHKKHREETSATKDAPDRPLTPLERARVANAELRQAVSELTGQMKILTSGLQRALSAQSELADSVSNVATVVAAASVRDTESQTPGATTGAPAPPAPPTVVYVPVPQHIIPLAAAPQTSVRPSAPRRGRPASPLEGAPVPPAQPRPSRFMGTPRNGMPPARFDQVPTASASQTPVQRTDRYTDNVDWQRELDISAGPIVPLESGDRYGERQADWVVPVADVPKKPTGKEDTENPIPMLEID